MAFKRPRVNRVLERIIRGLTWHYYQARVPDDVIFTIRSHTELGASFGNIVELALAGTFVDARGGAVFQYRGGRAVEDSHQSMWLLSFYNHGMVLAVVVTKEPTGHEVDGPQGAMNEKPS